jgi:hypothetical protein
MGRDGHRERFRQAGSKEPPPPHRRVPCGSVSQRGVGRTALHSAGSQGRGRARGLDMHEWAAGVQGQAPGRGLAWRVPHRRRGDECDRAVAARIRRRYPCLAVHPHSPPCRLRPGRAGACAIRGARCAGAVAGQRRRGAGGIVVRAAAGLRRRCGRAGGDAAIRTRGLVVAVARARVADVVAGRGDGGGLDPPPDGGRAALRVRP